MARTAAASFQAALIRYRQARAKVRSGIAEQQREREVAKVDEALDRLLAVPSPSLRSFGEKIRILRAEYGRDAQPRHIEAIYRDVLVVLMPLLAAADALLTNWPR